MIYRISFKLNLFSQLIETFGVKKKKRRQTEPVEIWVMGKQISNSSGKTLWNGIGPARNALRIILENAISDLKYDWEGDDDNDFFNLEETIEELYDPDIIMNTLVGTNSSYPIYLKKVKDSDI